MTAELLTYGLPTVAAVFAGAVAGGLTARKLRRPETGTDLVAVEPKGDEFVGAQIDVESVRWAESRNLPPEAAAVMAERLKNLHTIGTRKGWFE